MNISIKVLGALFISLGLLACGKKDEQSGPAQVVVKYTCSMHPQVVEDKPGTCPICGMELVLLKHSGNGSEIMLSDSQIKLGNITTTLVRYEDIGKSVTLTGTLSVNEEQTELVSSRVAGRIERLAIKEAGKRVSQGQILYEIYSEQLHTLEQEYILAQQQVEQLGQKDKRYQTFLVAAERKLLLVGLSKEQVNRLGNSKMANSRVEFLAPVSGIVARVDAIEGQYVSEGSPLYRVERLDKIWVEADLYPGEESLVKKGDQVNVIVNGFENIPVDGKVNFISPEYKASSQIITIRVEINNSKGEFSPGMQANVILSQSERKGIALPVDAVIRDEMGSHVWLLTPEGAYAPRMVETGVENIDKVEIISGLREKENVVITGAYLLYGELVLKKGGDPMAGHSHF